MRQNRMLFIRNLLYQLKRSYGGPMTFYKIKESVLDTKTGQYTTERQIARIKFVTVLPDVLARKFSYEHSFLAANRPFTYGAQWDQGTRIAIVDGQDIPKDFTITVETSAVFENKRYLVKTAERLDVGFGYILTLVRAENNLPLQELSFNLVHDLGVLHLAEGEL